jgi:Lon protease-like protein
VARRPQRVLGTTLAALLVLGAPAPVFLARLLGIGYDTPGSESARASATVEQAIGASEAVLLVVSSPQRTVADPRGSTACCPALSTRPSPRPRPTHRFRSGSRLCAVTERLPLFPLSTVLFPGLQLPLHIFEERYRQLIHDLTTGPVKPPAFGVIAIRSGREAGQERPALYDVGCTAVLRQVEPLPDGRFDVLSIGTRRFRLHDVDASGLYLVGDVEYLDEEPGEDAVVTARATAAAYLDYVDRLLSSAGQAPRTNRDLPTDAVLLSYLVAAAMVLDLRDKQQLLEAPDAAARLRAELALLRRERQLLAHFPSLPGTDLIGRGQSPN